MGSTRTPRPLGERDASDAPAVAGSTAASPEEYAGNVSRTLERWSAKLPLSPGDVVAGYAVERVIGLGGMAVVAVGAHTTERHRVAIKMLLPDNAKNQEVRKRFEREHRTLASLHSEHVPRAFGTGEHDGLPFMLVEYLDGTDLGEHLKEKGPLEVETAINYALQACHAIAEAHALGIVHRDLKPANLFLTRRTDGTPCIKLLDFGISKLSEEARGSEDSLVTRTRAVMGSPFYMSPEQMLSSRDVDARTDVWSLGVTLYELLTKTLPFAAEDTDGVCHRILHDQPTPLRKLRPTYPAELEAVLARALERNPSRRFQTIANFADRLVPLGPPHARYALDAIHALVRPADSSPGAFGPSAENPFERTLLFRDDNAESIEGPVAAERVPTATGDTTVYLKGRRQKGTVGMGLLLGASLGAFGLGAALGWGLTLDTDPRSARTQAAGPGMEPRPPAQETTTPPPAPTAAPPPTPTKVRVIDLDEDAPPPAPSAVAPAPSGPPWVSRSSPPPPAPPAPPAPPKPASSPGGAPIVGDFEF